MGVYVLSIEWDQNKFPRRQSEWDSFINKLAGQQVDTDPYEDFWLEQKSEMNPLKSPGIGKIAKCILGMANRLPDVAIRAMGGRGLMVCGLSQGKRVGVPRTEDHELENALNPFLGGEGPLWTAHRLPAEQKDREVLIIVVDPPKDGDTIFACHKESEGVTNGGIYVRSKTQTRAVRGQEHNALIARLRAGSHKPDVDISVGLVTPLFAVEWGADLIDEYLSKAKASLLASVSATDAVPPIKFQASRGLTSRVLSAFEVEETRSPADFVSEVEEWVLSSRRAVGAVAKAYLARALPSAVFRITNNSETYLRDIELKIHLEGEVESALYEDNRKLRLSRCLPERPRKYGPYTVTPHGLMAPVPMAGGGSFGPRWQSGFRNSGSVDAVFSDAALRPKSTITTADDDSVLFLPSGKEGDGVVGTWTLTADGINAVIQGSIELLVPELIELKPATFSDLVIDVPQTYR